MTQGIYLAVVTAILSLLVTGCASVRWTEDLFAKRQVEVDQRFARLETGVSEQGERIDRVETRVAQLDARLTDTREQILDASAQRADPPDSPTVARAIRPTPDHVPPAGRTLVAVVHVPFAFDRADVNPTAEAALATILKELRENPSVTIDLEGSTDSVGRLEYNVRLSERRVEAVKGWLVGHGVKRTRIIGSTARGPLPSGGAVTDSIKRRVMVKLMTSSE